MPPSQICLGLPPPSSVVPFAALKVSFSSSAQLHNSPQVGRPSRNEFASLFPSSPPPHRHPCHAAATLPGTGTWRWGDDVSRRASGGRGGDGVM